GRILRQTSPYQESQIEDGALVGGLIRLNSPDPKRLLELLSIAEHGSYTKAAAVLKISQPALSSNIAALERSVGARLLERSQNGHSLTELGALLVQHARVLRSTLERARLDAEQRKSGIEGSLAIGFSPAAATVLVPEAISRLCAHTPNIVVSADEDMDDRL